MTPSCSGWPCRSASLVALGPPLAGRPRYGWEHRTGAVLDGASLCCWRGLRRFVSRPRTCHPKSAPTRSATTWTRWPLLSRSRLFSHRDERLCLPLPGRRDALPVCLLLRTTLGGEDGASLFPLRHGGSYAGLLPPLRYLEGGSRWGLALRCFPVVGTDATSAYNDCALAFYQFVRLLRPPPMVASP